MECESVSVCLCVGSVNRSGAKNLAEKRFCVYSIQCTFSVYSVQCTGTPLTYHRKHHTTNMLYHFVWVKHKPDVAEEDITKFIQSATTTLATIPGVVQVKAGWFYNHYKTVHNNIPNAFTY